jgi:hypothetical protein
LALPRHRKLGPPRQSRRAETALTIKKNLAISKKKIWLAVAELGLNPNSATLKPISMKNVIARLLGNLRTVSAEVSR